LLESLQNLLQEPDQVSHHTLIMLLHYLWKSKSKFAKNYKRYNSKIVLYVIKMKHYMSYG